MAPTISRVNARLFWKALAVQAVALIVLFAVLVALPFPDDFFERWGAVTGPLASLEGRRPVDLLEMPDGSMLLASGSSDEPPPPPARKKKAKAAEGEGEGEGEEGGGSEGNE